MLKAKGTIDDVMPFPILPRSACFPEGGLGSCHKKVVDRLGVRSRASTGTPPRDCVYMTKTERVTKRRHHRKAFRGTGAVEMVWHLIAHASQTCSDARQSVIERQWCYASQVSYL